MVKIKENKVLSVIVDEVFTVDYDSRHEFNVFVYQNSNGEKHLLEEFDVEKELETIEELKVIALDWHNKAKITWKTVEPITEYPCLHQLELFSQPALVASIKGIDFIVLECVPTMYIIENEQIIEVVDISEENIICLSEVERFAIKWYYKKIIGVEF